MINRKFTYVMKLFSYIFLLLYFCFLLFGCTSTSPQSGSLSGTIQLQGEADHSGITLAIYQLSTLDPDIVEANQKWPHIGVIC